MLPHSSEEDLIEEVQGDKEEPDPPIQLADREFCEQNQREYRVQQVSGWTPPALTAFPPRQGSGLTGRKVRFGRKSKGVLRRPPGVSVTDIELKNSELSQGPRRTERHKERPPRKLKWNLQGFAQEREINSTAVRSRQPKLSASQIAEIAKRSVQPAEPTLQPTGETFWCYRRDTFVKVVSRGTRE